jgi:phosphomannomutase/phosphoglucomutase
MITASHNPPEYNGLKVVGGNGMEIPREDEVKIEQVLARKAYALADWRGVGTASSGPDIITTYLEGIQRHVDRNRIAQRRLRVVVDVGNGAQAVAAPYLLEALGCETFSLNAHVDGAFPARGPEPTPDKLTAMAEAVRASDAHFGVAYDGDGDRSIFCDERGQVYWGDRSGALLADYLLTGESHALVVTTVATSQALDDVVKRRGGRVLRTRVGSVDVSQAMMQHSALFGVEENGGCFYGPHIPVRDGAMTTALMADLSASREEPLSQLLEAVPIYFQSKAKVPCPDRAKAAVMERIMGETTGRVDRTDGAKIWQDERSWVLIRPSGTEPIIRLFAESDSERILKQMIDHYSEVLQQALHRATS